VAVAADPSVINDPARLRKLRANAERLGETALALQCNIRIAELAGQSYDDEIEREFWIAVTCAEEFKTVENGKTTRLSRTRQKYARVGALACITDWALDPKVTEGFRILLAAGRPDLTGEAIALRHPDKFSAETVQAASRKLKEHGVAPDTIR
jgi:hypothetical protein